jgi:hypothetical protein
VIEMDATEYKTMAVKIKTELEALEIQQEDIERRIARLKQALVGLIPLSEPPNDSYILDYLNEMTLTDAARQIIQAAGKPLTPTEIKQQLLNMGKDLSGQKNTMASIHSLLKRLAAAGEIETRDNGLTYQWRLKSISVGLQDAINALGLGMDSGIVPGEGNSSTQVTENATRKARLIEAIRKSHK